MGNHCKIGIGSVQIWRQLDAELHLANGRLLRLLGIGHGILQFLQTSRRLG
jgi:hypothetical protein